MSDEKRFCEQCGSQLNEGAEFCSACGAAAGNQNQYAPPQAMAPPPYGYQYNQYGQIPQRPPKKSKTWIIVLACVLTLLLIMGGVLTVVILNLKGTVGTVDNIIKSGQELIQHDAKPGETGEDEKKENETQPENKEEVKPDVDYTDPVTYVPAPFMRFTYLMGADEISGSRADLVIGTDSSGRYLATMVDIIPQSEAYAVHYMKGSMGIEFVYDGEEEEPPKLWIPYNLSPGQRWEDEYGVSEIISMGETVDLGFAIIENCMVIRYDSTYMDAYSCMNYVAPAMGTVMTTNRDTGEVEYRITDAVQITREEAQEIVDRFTIDW